MFVTIEGLPHPLVGLALVCYDLSEQRIYNVFNFDTETMTAVKLDGRVVTVKSYSWEVASARDASRLLYELDPVFHHAVKITPNGVCFVRAY